MRTRNLKTVLQIAVASLVLPGVGVAVADQVILDDLIVDGSACIGQDCVNGESFGFDTIRIKENNLRIKAVDTSSTASFPTTDWQITFNDSSNGGQSKFSIDDIDRGSTPFTIEAGGSSHSLYVDDGGRIGLGTSTPVVELHVVDGDTPTLRLEQNGSSGFTPQTWDLAGNETNFFIRDVTNGSKLPFRVRPDAPTSSIDIASSGFVGIGDTSPDANLDVQSSVAWPDPMAIFETAANDTGASLNLRLSSDSNPHLQFEDRTPSTSVLAWNIQFKEGGDLAFTNSAFAGVEMALSPQGDLTIMGDLTANGTSYTSSRSAKHNIEPIDPDAILAALRQLEISEWSYIRDEGEAVHIGPMAEEFHSAFELKGQSNDRISVSDVVGISLAAIQSVANRLDERDVELEALRVELLDLKSQIR